MNELITFIFNCLRTAWSFLMSSWVTAGFVLISIMTLIADLINVSKQK